MLQLCDDDVVNKMLSSVTLLVAVIKFNLIFYVITQRHIWIAITSLFTSCFILYDTPIRLTTTQHW